MNKIVCFGDGYAANHIWPEWPAIVQALYPDLDFENHGAVGAGDEFITSAVVQTHAKNPKAFFIVQWTIPQRFDKLLEDNIWNTVIDSDPVYHFNRVDSYGQTWWLSSASQQQEVTEYHKFYVQKNQAQMRSHNYRYLVENLLTNQAVFFTLEQMIQYSNHDRFAQIRQKEVQPSPPVHMCWVEEKILPKMPYYPDQNRLEKLKKRINQHKWVAFDPNREDIWNNMSSN